MRFWVHVIIKARVRANQVKKTLYGCWMVWCNCSAIFRGMFLQKHFLDNFLPCELFFPKAKKTGSICWKHAHWVALQVVESASLVQACTCAELFANVAGFVAEIVTHIFPIFIRLDRRKPSVFLHLSFLLIIDALQLEEDVYSLQLVQDVSVYTLRCLLSSWICI